MPENCTGICIYSRLGALDYEKACRLQAKLVEAVIRGESPERILFLTHPPVFTIGRRGGANNILVDEAVLEREGIAVFETDRGGDITYHGPGQLVGYPILNLGLRGRDIHLYLRNLEEALILMLADYGLRGERVAGLTGVWVDGCKVAAIGVGVRRWISFHGFALNVDPEMRHFSLINPCGITDKPVISMKDLLGDVDFDQVAGRTLTALARVFDLRLVIPDEEEVKELVAFS